MVLRAATHLEIFEELRFIVELLAAELVFLMPFVKPKKNFFTKCILLVVGYQLLSLIYFFIIDRAPNDISKSIVVVWYVILTFSTIMFCKALFHINIVDSLYVMICSFVAQHVIYVIVHEALALYYWTFLTEHLALYIAISILFCFIWYLVLYMFFARQLSECEGRIFDDSGFLISFNVAYACLIMASTFSAQHLFRIGDGVRNFGIIWAISICFLVLGIQYASFKSTLFAREQAIISRMLKDSAKHYEISRELIELVNRNAHDMKHQLKALSNVSDERKEEYVSEQLNHIKDYQNLVFCDNEVLNTILAEKSLYCSSKDITFSCSVKQANLDFIDVIDLYALLGNAIDNAIEGVSDIADTSKRVISVTVSTVEAFTTIQVENYTFDKIEVSLGLPITTKKEAGHGFGLKSIKHIANKYGGNMYWANKDGIFSLQVMFPLPTVDVTHDNIGN